MGSQITLEIEGLSLDYGKNAFWTNHAQLFQVCDYSPRQPDEDEAIAEEADENPDEVGGRYDRALGDTLGRLDLLGYSEHACRSYIQENISYVIDDDLAHDGNYDDAWVPLESQWVLAALSSVRLDLIHDAQTAYFQQSLSSRREDDFKREWLNRIREESRLLDIPPARFGNVLNYLHLDFDHGSSHPDELCHPYVVLRLLGTNPSNLARRVTWDHADLVLGGWAHKSDFDPYLDPANQILIVTEGSSDAAVLKKSLEQLRPDVADFFYFVDMAENYPFTGTGNLFRFAQGLSSIHIQNKVVILYDNDAEGCFNYKRTAALDRPPHLGVIKLPTLAEFNDYPTLGPDGSGSSDINGRAVSIELFLKAASEETEVPVRWASFHEGAGVYQGAIRGKSDRLRRFMHPSSQVADFPRIAALLDAVLSESTRVSEIARRQHERGNSHPWTFAP